MANALETWFDFLKDRPLPVQAAIALRVQQTLNRAFAAHHDFADILRFGPGMTIEVFRSLRRLKEPPKQPIETLPHAIAMLGLEPLQMATLRMPSIERLPEAAIPGLRLCFSRAIQSAYFAHRWAEIKKLSNPEAIALAALVDECAEMALWANAPEQMLAINRLRAKGSTSNDAALQVLGVPLNRISLKLAEYWFLPPLTIQSLSYNVYEARPLCVVLATNFTRTIDTQWDNPKSALLLELIHEYLNLKPEKLICLLHQQAAGIAQDAQFTGLPMAIHHLPFITENATIKAVETKTAPPRLVKKRPEISATKVAPVPVKPPKTEEPKPKPTPKPDKVKPVASPAPAPTPPPEPKPEKPEIATDAGKTEAPPKAKPVAEPAAQPELFIRNMDQLLGFLHRKIGLQRCMFARQDSEGMLVCEQLVGDETDALQGFSHPIRGTLFTALMQKPNGLWLNSGNRHRYKALIPKDAGDWAANDSFMMALFCHDTPVGLIYADNQGTDMNEKDFLRFTTAIGKFAQVMMQNQRCPIEDNEG